MDPARFDKVRARVLAKAKPLTPPPSMLEAPPSDSASGMTNPRTSPSRSKVSAGRAKSIAARKRKSPSSEDSVERREESASESSKRIKTVAWSEIEAVDHPEGKEFSFGTIDSLWYRNLDYGSYLRRQLLTSADQHRNEEFIQAHGPLRLIKSSVAQIARSTASILSIVPALAQTLREHAEVNLEEQEKLKKDLEAKEKELVDRNDALESARLLAEDLKARLNKSEELLLERDKELEVERGELKRTKEEAVALEAGLRKEVAEVEEMAFGMYLEGFDQVISQVKHFNASVPIDLDKIDRNKKLEEILDLNGEDPDLANV